MPQQRKLRILVPRLVDTANLNAQNLNAKAFLSRFRSDAAQWEVMTYGKPDPNVVANPHVTVRQLLPHRLWRWHMAAAYLNGVDAIFYPNKEAYDKWGLRWRSLIRRRVPMILTLEGLTGTEERERQLEAWAGHPVSCFRSSRDILASTDAIYRAADHIIAISPFLAEAGRHLYGNKFSTIPLGVDLETFKPGNPRSGAPPTVLAVGSVYARKRPEVFIDLAAAHPHARFRWLGDGELRQSMIAAAAERRIDNVEFPGPRPPAEIARAMQEADLLVLPSHAEGVPKVVQEAVACGLPVVLFGHYQAPSVTHGENGFVAWNDDELSSYVGQLLRDPELRQRMGATGAARALEWNWDLLAPKWEAQILDFVRGWWKSQPQRQAA